MLKTLRQYIENLWLSILIISILLVAFGLLAVIDPNWTISVMMLLTSILLLVFGAVSVVDIFTKAKRKESVVAPILSTLIFGGLGLGLLFSPDFSFDLILVIIGVVVILRGIADTIIGIVVQKEDSYKIAWTISGVLGLIAGVLIVTKPGLTGSILVIILGAYSIATGVVGIYYASKIKQGVNKITDKIKE